MDLLGQWYGSDRLDQLHQRARRFWAGEGRCLVSLWTGEHAYRQVFDDNVILRDAPEHLRHMSELPGVNLPAFLADFGTISTARYWGGEVVPPRDGAMIYIHPAANTLEQALAISPLPVDHPDMDGAHAVRLWRELSRKLGTDQLWLRTPDMQGTLNTAGLVLNQEEMLMAMYEQPQQLQQFLDRVCDFLIDYARYLRKETGDHVCGNIWPYPFFPCDMGLSLTEDLMPLLPPDLYERFGIPALRRLQDALGGLLIHCCGQYGQHVPTLVSSGLNIRAIEFHHPATTLDEVLPLALRGTVLIPYFMGEKDHRFQHITDYWRLLLKTAPPEARFWFCAYDDSPQARQFAQDVASLQPA